MAEKGEEILRRVMRDAFLETMRINFEVFWE